MLVVALILLWGVLALLALVALVCVTPLRLEVDVQKDTGWSIRSALRPLGRYGPRIPLRRQKARKPDAKERGRRRTRGRIVSTRVVPAALRLLRESVACIRLERVACRGRFGFDDPAETGMVFGMLTPLAYGLESGSRVQLDVEPVFDGAILAGRAELVLSLVPARLVAPAVRFGWRAFGPER